MAVILLVVFDLLENSIFVDITASTSSWWGNILTHVSLLAAQLLILD